DRTLVKNVDPGARVTLRDNVVVVTALPRNAAAWANAARVLRSVGSRPAHRDPIDARIIRSVVDGTGRIIDSQDQVGGYPIRPRTQRALVVPDGAEERRRWLNTLADDLNVAP